ncbi:NAD(P)-dependent oxidoreductase, partial [Bordetella pertussis]|uniref:NAD(P)-dependent oxidoreductase n=1 Tax=Bordetella pertussis TaxID=520 RepID=UPI000A99B3B7
PPPGALAAMPALRLLHTVSAGVDNVLVIHCGRGAHLVEADLQAALADGRLRGALVDVYAQEPLPPQHPLWRCPSLVITPHMASVAPFERVAGQILENLRRLNAGEALMNLVDPRRGY